MNVLLTPYSREKRIPEPLLVGLRSYNSNDGFGRVSGDQLNFTAPSEDEAEYPPGAYLKKGKVSRQDPMSHRIIEKRRRDRMNNCLADLSRLIPPEYLKKGRGRVEKTEIIEMAIRHLKYLQDRANAADHQSEDAFRAGYQEATAQTMRFLVEVQGYDPGENLCVALSSNLQRHIEVVTKSENQPREKMSHPGGSSSETSSSSNSHPYMVKQGVIAQAPQPTHPPFAESYDSPRETYSMDCDRVSAAQLPEGADGEMLPEVEPLALDARRKRSPSLRAVRKPEHAEDYLHSYKFKNSIERRFSRSQDNEAVASFCEEVMTQKEAAERIRENTAQADSLRHRRAGALEVNSRPTPHKLYSHKRRRGPRPAILPPSASTSTTSGCNSVSGSTSNSGSNEETRDTSPQDTSSESPHHHHYDKPAPPTQYVPIFALNETGKYYVPLTVDYACLARHLGPYGVLDGRVHMAPPLHPVSIHVNFQSCLNYHVKREPRERDWRQV